MTTGCSSDVQGGKAWTYLHARGRAGYANGACRCVVLHAIAGALPFSGTNRPSWTLAAWITTCLSTGLDGFKVVWMEPECL